MQDKNVVSGKCKLILQTHVWGGLGNAKAVRLWSVRPFSEKVFLQSIFLSMGEELCLHTDPSGSFGRCWGRGRKGNGRFASAQSENAHQLNPKIFSQCLK